MRIHRDEVCTAHPHLSFEELKAHEIVIRPSRGLVRMDWREFWEYRDLLVLLVRRDFVSKYAQTILGPAWFIIQPLLMTGVFTVVFGRIARVSTESVPGVLFYLSGLLGWGFFAQNFNNTASTFVNNAAIFGKVYFPRLVVPIASICSNFIGFLIQLATFLVFFAYFKFFTNAGSTFGLTPVLIFFPLIIVWIGLISLGVGLWLSALSAKYKDFVHLNAFLIQVWMYATPVIYPLANIPAKWQWLATLNPMTVPVVLLRAGFLGTGGVDSAKIIVSIVTSALLLVSGLLAFEKVERTFVDTV